jgi:hypothetical protein
MKLKNTILTLGLLALSAGAVFAQAGADEARVRVVHASTDAPAVDIYVNGGMAFESLPFGGFTDYTPLPPGTYEVSVRVAGTNQDVLGTHLTLMGGTDYSVLAIGRLDNASIRLVTFGDDLIDPGPDMAKVRVIHAASTAPGVDVYLTSPYAPLGGETPALSGVPFGAGSLHLAVPSGLYQGRVAVSGTTTVAIDSGPLRLEDNEIRTVVALDPAEEGGEFRLWILNDKN